MATRPANGQAYPDSPPGSGPGPYSESLAKLLQPAQDNGFAETEAYRILSQWRAKHGSAPDWEPGLVRLGKAIGACGTMWVPAVCDEGHRIRRGVSCGREQCPTCGQRGSAAHLRRFARILPKFQQLRRAGYFTVQFRRADRPQFRTVAALRRAQVRVKQAVQEFAQRHGLPTRALRSWDWFGDPKCPRCLRPGTWVEGERWQCQQCGQTFRTADVRPESMQWHPHQNWIVEWGYLTKSQITDLQARISRAVLGEWDADLKPDGSVKTIRRGVIVHYQYAASEGNPDECRCAACRAHADGPAPDCACQPAPDSAKRPRPCKNCRFRAQVLHWSKYIAKPTFLDMAWDPEMAARLAAAKFHRMGWAGTWKDGPAWSLRDGDGQTAALVALVAGRCPVDGQPLTWGPVERLAPGWWLAGWVDLGGGYFLGVSEDGSDPGG